MEWNWCWNGKNDMMDVTPFLLFESTGDSEEVKAHADEAAAMNESEDVLFQFDDGDDGNDENDDAQSSSYDYSSYTDRSYGNSHHDQTQRLIHGDFEEEEEEIEEEEEEEDDDDDDDDKCKDNWGESNLMDRSMQQKGSRKFCVDSLNQREIDRNFWETCLAT